MGPATVWSIILSVLTIGFAIGFFVCAKWRIKWAAALCIFLFWLSGCYILPLVYHEAAKGQTGLPWTIAGTVVYWLEFLSGFILFVAGLATAVLAILAAGTSHQVTWNGPQAAAAGTRAPRQTVTAVVLGAIALGQLIGAGFLLNKTFGTKPSPALEDLVEVAQAHDDVFKSDKPLNASLDPHFRIRFSSGRIPPDKKEFWKKHAMDGSKALGGPDDLLVEEVIAITFFSENKKAITSVVVEFEGKLPKRAESPGKPARPADLPLKGKGIRLPYNETEGSTTQWAQVWTKQLKDEVASKAAGTPGKTAGSPSQTSSTAFSGGLFGPNPIFDVNGK